MPSYQEVQLQALVEQRHDAYRAAVLLEHVERDHRRRGHPPLATQVPLRQDGKVDLDLLRTLVHDFVLPTFEELRSRPP